MRFQNWRVAVVVVAMASASMGCGLAVGGTRVPTGASASRLSDWSAMAIPSSGRVTVTLDSGEIVDARAVSITDTALKITRATGTESLPRSSIVRVYCIESRDNAAARGALFGFIGMASLWGGCLLMGGGCGPMMKIGAPATAGVVGLVAAFNNPSTLRRVLVYERR